MDTLGPPQADPSTTTSRKALLLSFENAGYLKPFFALFVDIGIFAGGLTLVLMDGSVWLKILGSALITAGIVRLFLIGHDACHGSFFKSQLLNDIFGRVAFLPSMTAFSLWDVGHNVAHHGFNNLKGRDQVWAPYSKSEFDALPRQTNCSCRRGPVYRGPRVEWSLLGRSGHDQAFCSPFNDFRTSSLGPSMIIRP